MQRPQIIAATFLLLIFLGTIGLLLPGSMADGGRMGFADAVFMSTSAVCVTGLTTIDPGSQLSMQGQIIILLLIQMGGLGIMTMSALMLILLQKRLDRQSHQMMIETYSGGLALNTKPLLLQIASVVLLAEGIGAVLLFSFLPSEGDLSFRIWSSIFHSISAFCNAGFSLHSDSLMHWGNNYAALTVTMVLIVLGGLGFFVVGDFRRCFTQKNHRMAVQTKLVLVMTATLTLLGAVVIWFAEYNGTLPADNYFASAFHALFQSVTARTAGFNTIQIGGMTDFGLFVLIGLMFVGGSPGSTAGGVKTTTVGIVMMTLVSHLRRRRDVEMFRRRVALETVQRSFIIMLMMLLFIITAFILMRVGHLYIDPEITESGRQYVFIPLAFETVSAACTVGLSAGFTDQLSAIGKMIVVVLMFAGRLGPLTLAYVFVDTEDHAKYRLPEEPVMVG